MINNNNLVNKKKSTYYITDTQINSIKVLRNIMGYTLKEITKEVKLSLITVCKVLKDKDPLLDDIKLINSIGNRARASWRVLGHKSKEHITDEKLEKSSALQLATIGAISEDKARVIEGEVTQRIGFDDLTDLQLEDKLAKDQELLKRLEKGEVIDVDIDEMTDSEDT